MNGFSPNLFLAALGPLAELFGVMLIVAAFALLRSQADRRTYFKEWERSWGFLAVSLAAGLVYERFIDPESVLYPASPVTTRLIAIAFLAFRMLSVVVVLNGAQLYARGTRVSWLPKLAIVAAIVFSFLGDTSRIGLAPLATLHGPLVTLAYAWVAYLFVKLPASRRSTGTRIATIAFTAITALTAALTLFYVVKHFSPSTVTIPWLIRFARYAFYSDLLLQFAVAWAMVLLLVEDGKRESNDTRAHLKLVQDRDLLGELYDDRTRLLGRRAFDAMVGLDFARASFGTVAHVRLTNFNRVTAEHGMAVSEALLANLAGVLDSAVRAHDRVYRWGQDQMLVVMPRAIPGVARERVEFLTNRAAPLTLSSQKEPLRAELAISVQPFTGGEDLPQAALTASAS